MRGRMTLEGDALLANPSVLAKRRRSRLNSSIIDVYETYIQNIGVRNKSIIGYSTLSNGRALTY